MRRLLPVTDDVADREWTLAELADAYAYPETDGPWLRANMVSTLDGAAQHEGRSQPISGSADMRIFGTLRGLADAVVVGAETVRQEGRGRRRVRAPRPGPAGRPSGASSVPPRRRSRR
ncbi:dihydrofolate reductase family protein, partial [Streptomyces albidoflavus]